MQSESRATRENQKKTCEQLIQARLADLKKKGLSPKEYDKDKVYEHLKAKQRALMKAIAAIDALEARKVHAVEAAAEEAAPIPAAPKEKKPKKKAAPAKSGH